MRSALVVAAAMVLVTSVPARASLIGTQVTGALYFVGYPQNYFDPVNGRVPAGYLNVAGTTVTISSEAVEYGFADGTATITADFTGMQLTITDTPQFTAHYNALEMVFTNLAFTNLATVSDSLPNGGMAATLSGSVITLNWDGGDVTNGVSLQAVFNVNVPASPLLSIQLTSTNAVVIAWPAPSTGFSLEQNSNLNPTGWVNVTNTPVVTDGLNQVIVSPSAGAQFYRLKLS
jgi:hypothetical protein